MILTSDFNPIIHVYPPKKEYVPARKISRDPGREYHQLAFFTEGRHDFLCGGKHLVAEKNSLLYLPKGHSVDFIRDVPSECYHISFQLSKEELYEPFCIIYPNAVQFQEIFEKMYRLQVMRNAENDYETITLLYKIFSLIHTNLISEYCLTKQARRIACSVEYISQNYLTEDISVTYLADMCHISTRYYSKIFHAYYGCSPQKYITQLKINHAKRLLQNTKLKVSDIAAQSNFNDVYHFCKMFKKATDCSPTEYRDTSSFDPF